MSVLPTSYRFHKMSPGGNPTILLMGSDNIDPMFRPRIAASLMDPLHLHAEQVGFVTLSSTRPRLEMMGGEFCGNACRCVATLLAMETGQDGEWAIDVSGVDRPIKVWANTHGTATEAWSEVPVHTTPDCITEVNVGIHRVDMDGITHLLLDAERHMLPEDFEEASTWLRKEFELEDLPAVGCIWYMDDEGEHAIFPSVWVRDTGTTYLESACGSGTMALAQLIARDVGGDLELDVYQPSGGIITAKISYDSTAQTFSEAYIGGQVSPVASGETYL